jgi:hypothetical protein
LGARHGGLDFIGGQHQRRQVEPGLQHATDPGLAADGDPRTDQVGDVAIDRPLRCLELGRERPGGFAVKFYSPERVLFDTRRASADRNGPNFSRPRRPNRPTRGENLSVDPGSMDGSCPRRAFAAAIDRGAHAPFQTLFARPRAAQSGGFPPFGRCIAASVPAKRLPLARRRQPRPPMPAH